MNFEFDPCVQRDLAVLRRWGASTSPDGFTTYLETGELPAVPDDVQAASDRLLDLGISHEQQFQMITETPQ